MKWLRNGLMFTGGAAACWILSPWENRWWQILVAVILFMWVVIRLEETYYGLTDRIDDLERRLNRLDPENRPLTEQEAEKQLFDLYGFGRNDVPNDGSGKFTKGRND